MISRKARTRRNAVGFVCLLAGSCSAALADDPRAPSTTLTADETAALDRINASSLRGHLSFIASDLLEGRDTPSRGLDLAAEYIAAQFRRAGLEPIGDDGYFQTANWKLLEPDDDSFRFVVNTGNRGSDRGGQGTCGIPHAFRPSTLKIDHVIKVDPGDASAIEALTPRQVEGKAVLTELRGVGTRDRVALMLVSRFMTRMAALKAALVINVARTPAAATGLAAGRAIDPENPRPADGGRAERPGPPLDHSQ